MWCLRPRDGAAPQRGGPGRPPAQEAAGAPGGPGQAGSSLFVRSGSSAGRNLEITSYPVLSARDCGADRHGPRFCSRLRNGRLLTRPSPPRAAAGAGPRGGVRRCGPCAVPHSRHVPCDARVVPRLAAETPSGAGHALALSRGRPAAPGPGRWLRVLGQKASGSRGRVAGPPQGAGLPFRVPSLLLGKAVIPR